MMHDRNSTEAERGNHRSALERNQQEMKELEDWDLSMAGEIAMCSSIEALKEMRKKLWERTRTNV
jgi:hypothetical protein